MFVEMRQYTLKVGAQGQYVKAYTTEGYAIQRRHLGEPVGYYVSEVGDLNQVVHLWRYDSFDDRTARRKALWADPEWLAYAAKLGGLVGAQKSTILYEVDLPKI